jgi:hypothetical protein
MMADDPTKHAIDVVAHSLLASGRFDSLDPGACWEDYPDIGENDWRAVESRAVEITDAWMRQLRPTEVGYEAAYEHLKSRTGES